MSLDQKEFLIQYMEDHLLFAKHQIMELGCQGNKNYQRMWRILQQDLNNIGPLTKTPEEWKEV